MYQKGFTLIELLVVISIIGTLSSVILASLNSARAKAYDAAIMASVNEFAKLMQLEYSDTGSYAALEAGWDTTTAECNNSFSGNYAANARQICGAIVTNQSGVGGIHTGDAISGPAAFSVMAYLPYRNTAYCVGSSGARSSTCAWGTWTCGGCYSNP